MATNRISPLEPPYEPEVESDLKKIMPPGVEPLKLFKTVAHNPRILRKFMNSNLLDRGSIDWRDREIFILRTCARCGAENEWGVHVVFFADRVGLTTDQVAASVKGDHDDPAWSQQDGLLIRLADELHDTAHVSDDLWESLTEHWEPPQLIEFVAVAGFYHTVSFMINAAGIELEDWAARFPA